MNSARQVDTIAAHLTSFHQLFGLVTDQGTINRIEIPLFQRDYAQGRRTPDIERVRSRLIAVVCAALQSDAKPIELDFVYGDVDQQGTLVPLDGQQRLTLLFLLHCYLAWHVDGIQADQQPWARFSYATRPGARKFCAFLTCCRPDFTQGEAAEGRLSAWLVDQADYLPTWGYDPTIQSMLVVLECLDDWFSENPVDFLAAWNKLTVAQPPAVRFHLLAMAAGNKTDAQYIKMNSRGKPLTHFENFKVEFEELVKAVHPDRAADIARKLDTAWSDILWPYRGDDNLIDDEFMRYFRFVTEVCAWKNTVPLPSDGRADDLAYLTELAEGVYRQGQAGASDSLGFLVHAFDTWQGHDIQGQYIKGEFEHILTTDRDQAQGPRLFSFRSFEKEGVDLFHACCRHYGSRAWDLADTLLLYAVLLVRRAPAIDDVMSRLRVLRNLIEASGNEIRAENMKALLDDVAVILAGDIARVGLFNQVQKQNELDKAVMLQAKPRLRTALYRLEDHDLLRGGLTAFDLDDTASFQARAVAFLKAFDKSAYSGDAPWLEVTGALLAQGDYSTSKMRPSGYVSAEFGSPGNDEPWRALFRGKARIQTHPMRDPLMRLLDTISSGISLHGAIDRYLNARETLKDWRYYLVKYPTMRRGAAGRYVFSHSRYEACMLERRERMSSYYYDPYLWAALEASGIGADRVTNPDLPTAAWPKAYYGYETEPRRLRLKGIGIRLRSVDAGWEVSHLPTAPARQAIWQQAVTAVVGIAGVTRCQQDDRIVLKTVDQNGVDAVDRIAVAATLLRALMSRYCAGTAF